MVSLDKLVERYPALGLCSAEIEQAARLLSCAFRDGGKLLVCGNGGSAADAEHIVGELMKGFYLKRSLPPETQSQLLRISPQDGDYLASCLQRALPAVSLVSHTALSTAIANDTGADLVFAQQVYGLGRPGDVLLGISVSGNSRNVLLAMQVACAVGMHTIGLTGPTGGVLRNMCDIAICAPGEDVPAVQEHHLPIYHYLCARLEQEFFI